MYNAVFQFIIIFYIGVAIALNRGSTLYKISKRYHKNEKRKKMDWNGFTETLNRYSIPQLR